jgi:hypothetical protein
MDTNTRYEAMYTFDCSLRKNIFACVSLLLYSGCAPTSAEYQYGFALSEIVFSFFDDSEGIHPSRSALSNPDNPFSKAMPSKWDIESAGYPAASFYSWATTLAFEPTGEHQFYAAQALHNIYDRDLCVREECYFVHKMTIDAYKTQLDFFSYSVSYTADGIPFPIDVLAYDAIIALGGSVDNWIKILDEEGNEILIPKEEP